MGIACRPTIAGEILDRARARGEVRCGGMARPGVLAVTAGTATGVLADACRAIAQEVLGPTGQASVDIYDSDRSFDAVRQGEDDVAFLTDGEIAEQQLAGTTRPGPVVFTETTGVMVDGTSTADRLRDLAGQTVCFDEGSKTQRDLDGWAAATGTAIIRRGFQEPDEMHDAFAAKACEVVVGTTTVLAGLRHDGLPGFRNGRILRDTLGDEPLRVVTVRRDAAWGDMVAGIVTMPPRVVRLRP